MQELVIEPRDGFFVKDGRGWYTSASGRSHGLAWPTPRTLRGALRTGFGRKLEGSTKVLLSADDWEPRTSGVKLHRTLPVRRWPGDDWSPSCRMWPVPMDAVYLPESNSDHVTRLMPTGRTDAVKVRSGLEPEPWNALWWPRVDDQSKPEEKPQWWTELAFVDWLCGDDVALAKAVEREKLGPQRRTDVHLAIAPDTLTAAEGLLYTTDVVEPFGSDQHEWGIAASVELPSTEDLRSIPLTLGGKRRLCRVRAGSGLFAMPAKLQRTVAELESERRLGRYFRLTVVTPADLAQGWIPRGFACRDGAYRGALEPVGEVILRAAMMDRSVSVSGYDMVRGPRRTSRLVPPGTVYFFERQSGDLSAADFAALWLATLGSTNDEGLGWVVPGVWTPG